MHSTAPPAGLIWLKSPAALAAADEAGIAATVSNIISEIRERGDAAVRDYSRRFDKHGGENLEVTMAEREQALAQLDSQTRRDTEFAIANVRNFAAAQLACLSPLDIELLPGVFLGHRIIPVARVGCYVPGGRYPLLSAPVMSIVPAKVANVDEIIACLPPQAHSAMIAGCHLAGADRIFRIGGAQAIAAMAFGTASVPRVDKIVGPGNAFVNEAKRQCFGAVGIDQLAGPSEIYILADETADAAMLATDLLAQAEHDVRTRVGLITTHAPLAQAVLVEVEKQLETLATAATARPAWESRGEIAVAADEQVMVAYSDCIAAEHLQVHTRDAHGLAKRLRNFGSLFIGELASVVYSDKCSGTNHTLPTMAAARYTGGLWVGTYVKVATHQWMTPEGVRQVAPPAVRQSAAEGLEGHRRAAQLRLDRLQAFRGDR
jgi:histidinol dehydrogenase/sulfopropanediol 3-dehydrogenase